MKTSDHPGRHLLVRGIVALAACHGAHAQELPELAVTATRLKQSPFEIGASVDAVTAQTMRNAGPLVNLSEALTRLPGLSVLNRQNHAQDLQVSSRGFGARSAFGVRGIRLYADGIPLTMPDGQGQASSIDLEAAQRIEVLRGPMSALYGNASGGVIQVFTEDGPPRPEVTLGQSMGPDGFQRQSLKLGGEAGQVNYAIHASHFDTDGFRAHSAARRDQVNAKLKWVSQSGSSLTLVGSYLNMPDVQDPLGLTREQMASDRRQAGSGALLYDTRKSVLNQQLGIVHEGQASIGEFRVLGYAGSRSNLAFQAIPANSVQDAARHPGGVIDFDRSFNGVDARITRRMTLWSRPLSLIGGFSFDQMNEHRKGFENYLGTVNSGGPSPGTQLGVIGELKRDERNRATSSDQYLQAEWALSDRWSTNVGVRNSRVSFRSQDDHVTAGNPDDSGTMAFSNFTPVGSLVWKPQADRHLYITGGRSFETPTLNEVAYQSNGSTGWNQGLRASRGRNIELGLKQALPHQGQVTLATFQSRTADEIGVDVNAGGRATYKNLGQTSRRGVEASLDMRLATQWRVYSSLTWNQARFRNSFSSTSQGVVAKVPAGHDLPGIPDKSAFVELLWRPTGQWHAALEARHVGRIWANDVNTEAASACTLLALRAGWTRAFSDWRLSALVRLDNLTDKRHAGSVIVNEGNKRYYEPAPGRSGLVSLRVAKMF